MGTTVVSAGYATLNVQGLNGRAPLKELIEKWSSTRSCNRLRVAAAYATVSGVRDLTSAFSGSESYESSWLIGLDDFITQPGALSLMQSIPGASIRVVSKSKEGSRFHPKLYCFETFSKTPSDLFIVGSSNLTSAAFRNNCEANILRYGSGAVPNNFSDIWSALWNTGEDLTQERYDAYEEAYLRIRPLREALEAAQATESSMGGDDPVVEALSSDRTELDPSLAKICWIEGGNITLMGRELEFKAEQALFFGLPASGGPERWFQFRVSSGAEVALKMKYQGNHMWRLQLNDSVPEVQAGLRPTLPGGGLGRSPYVAVFEKTESVGTLELSFIRLDSDDFKTMIKDTQDRGAYGRTRARQYGWL